MNEANEIAGDGRPGVPVDLAEGRGDLTKERTGDVPVGSTERRGDVPVDSTERRGDVPVDRKERRGGVPVDSALRARLESTRGKEYWRSLEALSETSEFKDFL